MNGFPLLILCLFIHSVASFADIAIPTPSNYSYAFSLSDRAGKDHSFYYRYGNYPAKPLETGKLYTLDGVKPTVYGDRGKPVKDQEHTLKVWAKENATQVVTDTLFFYSYFSEGGYGPNTVSNLVVVKKISGRKIVYKLKEQKVKAGLPAESFPESNNGKLPGLVLMCFTSLVLLTGIFFWQSRKANNLSGEI